MPERTPKQVAADNRLEDAISEALTVYDIAQDGEVCTAWVVAGAMAGADEDRATYFTLHPGGVQPGYVAVGLLRHAEHHMLSGEIVDGDS